VTHLPFGDAGALAGIDERTAAVVVEPIQAEGGVRIPADDFLPRSAAAATRRGRSSSSTRW
jgi:acetylornithine/succinyldiaminopimelate/putrescine aminotransferase